MKNIKILAIDDNSDNLTVLSALLSESFPEAKFISATSGQKGIELCLEENPDVVLCDIVMSGLDGYDVCQKLKSDARTKIIPVIIIIAARADKESRIKALEMGADTFLTKPVDASEFKAQIRAMLRIKESEELKLVEKERLKKLVEERTRELEKSQREMAHLVKKLKTENEERKKTESALRESEERFLNLFERAPLGYQSLDENGCFIEVNEAWCNTLGYTSDEVLGKWFGDFLAPEYIDAFRERFSSFKDLGLIHSEFEMIHKNGNRCFIAFEGRIGRKKDGSFEKTHCILQDITDRKVANKGLLESEEKYRNIFENIQDVYYEADIEGTILVLSPSIESATHGQLKAEDLIGKSIYDFYSREGERDKLLDILQEKNSVTDYEITLKNRDGSLIPCSISSKLVLDENGKPLKTLGSIRDISERKKTDEALQESEEKYRKMVDLLPDAVIIHVEGIVVFANDAAFSLVGATSADQVLNKPALDFVHPDDRPAVLSRIQQIYESGEPSGYSEERFIDLKGETFIVEAIGIPVNYLGKPAVQTIVRDITARKRAEIALQEQKNEFETIFNLVPAQIWYKDTHNNIIRVNQEVCKDIGLPCSLLEGRATEELFPQFASQFYADDLEVIRSGKPKLGIVEQINTASGELRWHHTNKVPVFDNQGEVKGIIAFALDITKSKEDEEALKASRERWESFFNNSPNPIAVYQVVDNGDDFIFTGFNKSAEKTDKIKREALVGKRFSEMFPGAEEMGLSDVFRRVWKSGKTEHLKSSYYKDNRIEGWRENIVYRLNTGEIVAIYNDVSDRMKYEKNLKDSELRYRQLAENSPIPVVVVSAAKGNFLYANQSTFNLVGELPEGKSVQDFYTSDFYIVPRQREELMAAMSEKGSVSNREVKLRTFRGDEITVISSARFTIFENKPAIFISFYNITDRKKAELKLKERNNFIQTVLDNLPIGISLNMIDEGIATYMNKKFEEIYGWDAAEITSIDSFFEHVYPDPEYRKKITTQVVSDIQSGDPNRMHWENILITRKDGTQRTVNAVNIPLVEQNTMVSTVTDITDLHKSRLELIQAKEKAEEADRLKSAFLANMSHEIRTPLNSIIGFSELVTDPDFDQEKRLTFGRMIRASGTHLLSIISDILDFSKIEAGQVEMIKKTVNASRLIQNVHHEYEFEASEKGIELRIDPENHEEETFVESDEVKIRQVLINLVGNAIKFTKTGYVEIGLRTTEDSLLFHVKDTGIGIPAEYHFSIFERFRQIEPAYTRKYGGNGLGLAISKSLVEMLGGKIWIESEVKKGSTFYFSIPK